MKMKMLNKIPAKKLLWYEEVLGFTIVILMTIGMFTVEVYKKLRGIKEYKK